MKVPFLDLPAQHAPLKQEILDLWAEIYESASFVSGPRVAAFERGFAEAHEVDHAVAVSNGTAALELALRALDIRPGDRVVVPANTFVATAGAVANIGAVPLLVDCDPTTRTIDVEATLKCLTNKGVRAVIPVHLYGQPADMDPIVEAARTHGLAVIEDAAQAHLARYKGRPVGGLGDLAAFSFYPGKNLGAPGEGGAVTTQDADLAARLRMLRDHGQDRKYNSRIIGTNARMSEITAATLTVKLRHLSQWTEARRTVAAWYYEALDNLAGVTTFPEPFWAWSVYHLFVIEVDDRERLGLELDTAGIGTGLHYPTPIHLHPAFAFLRLGLGSFPIAEAGANRLLSLPMFPEMTKEQVTYVADCIRSVISSAPKAVSAV